jgi:hypothetical protein
MRGVKGDFDGAGALHRGRQEPIGNEIFPWHGALRAFALHHGPMAPCAARK